MLLCIADFAYRPADCVKEGGRASNAIFLFGNRPDRLNVETVVQQLRVVVK
ncbi:hypothetical protein D3C76_1553040 [compost metagenome]